MIRELTMTTIAALMLASNAFGADVAKDAKANERPEERAAEAAKVDAATKESRKVMYTNRIKSMASDLVKAAQNDTSCDAICRQSMESLEKVVRQKQELGLGDTIKPEKAIHDIDKKVKAGKSISVALDESVKENGIKQKEMIDCAAGK